MKRLIYHNFDKLEISFMGAFPSSVLEKLNAAKEEAQISKKNIVISMGLSGKEYRVYPNGVGGVSIGFESMDEGIQVGTQNTGRRDLWNIFVGVRSHHIAINGYYKVKDQIISMLEDLGAKTDSRFCPFTGEFTERPLESIRRADYCFDFHLPDFTPKRENIVYHKNAKLILHGNLDIRTTSQGITDNSLSVGSKKTLQIEIYNKTKEIQDKGNEHWFSIWNKEYCNLKPVWRVECRMCKEFLRRNDMLSFTEFESRFSDRLETVLNTIRYTDPSMDTNRSRWQATDFWQQAAEVSRTALDNRPRIQDPALVKSIKNRKSLEQINKMIPGVIVSKAVLDGVPYTQIMSTLENVSIDLKQMLIDDPEKIKKMYDDREKKYQVPDY